MTEKLESEIEQKAVKNVRRSLKCLQLKLYERHYPDRLILLPKGRAIFVEFKQSSGSLRTAQNIIQALLSELGFEVFTVYSEKEYEELFTFYSKKKEEEE
jgi:hypothetical protein